MIRLLQDQVLLATDVQLAIIALKDQQLRIYVQQVHIVIKTFLLLYQMLA